MAPSDPIARSVLEVIQARGTTIIAVARASGVHRDVIGRWLAGTRSIRVADAIRVMAALGLEVQVSEVSHAQECPAAQLCSTARGLRTCGLAPHGPLERQAAR